MKKGFLWFILILYCFCIKEGNALVTEYTPSMQEEYHNYEYVIDAYDVNLEVYEDNTIKVQETITANFQKTSHGIIRTIPLEENESISNVEVNQEFTTTEIDDEYQIQIGSTSQEVIGTTNYVITYTLDLKEDEYFSFDELYYHIIGTEWDTAIGNITFQMNLPKEFDATGIKFYGGNDGYIDQSNIDYTVENTTIKGSYRGILEKYRGIAVYLELPDGYFKASLNSNTPSKLSKYHSYPYVIDAYDVHIKVNENNTLDITETITAYFNEKRHGIIRRIPLTNFVERLDGTTEKNRVQISNVTVNNTYTTTRENGNYVIQIGSANKTLTGSSSYVIKYRYNLGKDKTKDYDELYFNIIGTDWDTVIGNITFTIDLPKDFDETKVGFSSGSYGQLENQNISYQIENNTITGRYDGILEEKEGLTIRTELDEGYFVGAKLNYGMGLYFMLIIPISCFIASLVLWLKFGRDKKVIETVEFYPPEGFNSLEVGYLYKGKAEKKDVISLMIYLANQGYIKISETEETSLFAKSKSFKITKIKEYDGNDASERLFLTGLFKMKDEVRKEDLENSFYLTMNEIITNMSAKENKEKIFVKNGFTKPMLIGLMMMTFLATLIPPAIEVGDMSTVIMVLFIFSFYAMFLLAGMMFKRLSFTIVWTIMMLITFLPVFITLPFFEFLQTEPIFLIGFIVGILSFIGIIVFFKLMPKRTDYGIEMLGKIKGFKNFLETAEKDKLEAMVEQNPTYFYDILPYTYVLGISDKWIKKFESIATEPPTWYDSSSAFDMVVFTSFMNTTMTSATHAMTQSPSSGGGYGGSSGGGSSGGGSGGGGGSSW